VLGIPIILQNFIPIGKGVSFPRMRDFAHHFVYSSTVWEGDVLPLAPSQDAHTDFHGKYKNKGPFTLRADAHVSDFVRTLPRRQFARLLEPNWKQ